ncbi:3-oxoadipate enol-lactonase [Aurantimonas sp. VKM B-3413]|uniref:3-oxoadipate enol-lactonase n=1 Tax=Aurantimonas sp. VKM B-3413 TaxID=2779401 RepID=UPI001E64AC60|nr:3-oxoadipate enol-lactonase [Aurantimonas sp. VKM B-3413]MCB8838959.1 3-oxoadipate enol-lactonase [Aurantimonas sp. VKM B-3413]
MAFARVNGIVVHYGVEGNPDAPSLVLINSLGTDFRIWDAFVDELGGAYRILRYDKRGHGLSEATPAPYAMKTHVDDLAALMDAVGMKSALLVGLSIGGMIAQGLAASRPDMVKALVLMDTAHKIGTAGSWNERIEKVEAGGIASLAGPILERWFTPAYRRPDNADFAGYANMLLRTPVAGYVGSCAALRDADYTEAAKALALPVLCIVGDQDGSTPPDLVRATSQLIPGAGFEIVAGAGHLPCIEQAEKTGALVHDFATKIFGGDAAR